MNVKEFINIFEKAVPPSLAWKGDNVGLQVGRETDEIKNILIALDLTEEVIYEAKKKNVNFIITHHPLLFHPIKKITPKHRVSALAILLIENKINLYSAHTNLDSVQWGVNFALAKTLGLTNLRILSPVKESLSKISVFVPKTHLERVAEAMHNAGAGMFSKYDLCSFITEGIGTFRGMNNANPFIGSKGQTESVEEVKFEVLCETWKSSQVIKAMLSVHPYEEAAYDIYPLLNKNSEYGLGAIGEFEKNITGNTFLELVARKLNAKQLRYAVSSLPKKISRAAVCGGSGAEFIDDAISAGAEAFVTADLKYHVFQEYEKKIFLVDAGHYETEHVVLPEIQKKCKEIAALFHSRAMVFITKKKTNPIQYYTSSAM